jgi:hypothetical protein
MRISSPGIALLTASIIVGGCSGKRASGPVQEADPNAVPSDYRHQVATYLRLELPDREDFRGAMIAAPALKPVGASQHIVVCVQLNGRNQRKDKVAVYLGGVLTQFVDSTPEQCAGAAYQPFTELQEAMPNDRGNFGLLNDRRP